MTMQRSSAVYLKLINRTKPKKSEGYRAMNSYEFLSVFLEWFNRVNGSRHGKFSWIDAVSVVPAGCGEGTCQWENIVIEGDGEDHQEKRVELQNVDIFDFFRSVSRPS